MRVITSERVEAITRAQDEVFRDRYATGWYGVPGTHQCTKVHIVHLTGPVCGSRPNEDYRFQWCARGVRIEYVDCEGVPALERAAPRARYQGGAAVTYTYVIMDVSPETYDEIKGKLIAAGYEHALHHVAGAGPLLDMHGLALAKEGQGRENLIKRLLDAYREGDIAMEETPEIIDVVRRMAELIGEESPL